jgi:hypothetical protein
MVQFDYKNIWLLDRKCQYKSVTYDHDDDDDDDYHYDNDNDKCNWMGEFVMHENCVM